MTGYICLLSALVLAAAAAPPAPPHPLRFQQPLPAHLQNLHPLDYFSENSELVGYYNQNAHQKQGNVNGQGGAPSRLENLEPDSEVELLPGAQQPQQPPQQNPVSPNLPGLVPGQRVFIVHMPVPGYRPGTIGGYQPVYIVAAAPQGNNGYPAGANGYQNAVLLNPAGQGYSPFLYPGAGLGQGLGIAPAGHAGLLVPGYNRPFEQAYQDPGFAYQQGPAPGPHGAEGARAVQLSQLVTLQAQHPATAPRSQAATTADQKRVGEATSNETKEEPRRNTRPTPAHVQSRKV